MIILSYEKNVIDKIINIVKRVILEVQGFKNIPTETEQDYYHNRGCNYLWKRKYVKALKYFKKMTENDNSDFLGYQRLGDVYKEAYHFKEAQENYELALQKTKGFKNKNNRNIDVKNAITEIKQNLADIKNRPADTIK